jgi:integrase
MKLSFLHQSPALQPHELSELAAQAVEELLREGESQNTLASYRSALRYWAAWFGLRYGQRITLPVPAAAVLQFVVDHAQRTSSEGLRHELPAGIDRALVDGGFKGKPGALALNTVVHRVAVLSKAHQLRGLKNPCHDAKVKELLSKTRRAYAKRGDGPEKKDALTREPLQALLDTCDNSLRGKRDRALLLFAWGSGGRRRSEVAGAELRFLKAVDAAEFSYELVHSKTHQSGCDRADNHSPIVAEAAQALRAWLDAANISDGRIFRRIRRGGHVGEALTPAAVREIVRDRCALAGLAGDFSAHSLRSGFVSEAARQELPLGDTMALTGHRSVQTLVGYQRPASGRTAARRLLSGTMGSGDAGDSQAEHDAD